MNEENFSHLALFPASLTHSTRDKKIVRGHVEIFLKVKRESTTIIQLLAWEHEHLEYFIQFSPSFIHAGWAAKIRKELRRNVYAVSTFRDYGLETFSLLLLIY